MGEKKALNELESGRLMESAGIPMVRSVVIHSDDLGELEHAAEQVGFPLVMKVLSDDILHKSDMGGVVLNVGSREEMARAYDTIMENTRLHAPEARLQGILVQQMLPRGLEVLLGVSTDPQFGPVIMVGLGGVLVELLKAVSVRTLPIRRADALEMIDETPLKQACQGLRGVKYSRDALAGALMALSDFVCANPDVQEIDINPFVMSQDGQSGVGVDAVVIRSVSEI